MNYLRACCHGEELSEAILRWHEPYVADYLTLCCIYTQKIVSNLIKYYLERLSVVLKIHSLGKYMAFWVLQIVLLVVVISSNNHRATNQHRTIATQIKISAASQKSDHNLAVTKLECNQNQCKNYEKMKIFKKSRNRKDSLIAKCCGPNFN